MTAKRVTSAAVNKALAAAGFDERLYKGHSDSGQVYWYFGDGDAPDWGCETMVPVPRVSDLTVEQWLQEHATRREEYLRHR